jgi:hypothetical protein
VTNGTKDHCERLPEHQKILMKNFSIFYLRNFGNTNIVIDMLDVMVTFFVAMHSPIAGRKTEENK